MAAENSDWEALDLEEIMELLEDMGLDLDDDALAATARFVKEAGGIEAALEAIAGLNRKAA